MSVTTRAASKGLKLTDPASSSSSASSSPSRRKGGSHAQLDDVSEESSEPGSNSKATSKSSSVPTTPTVDSANHLPSTTASASSSSSSSSSSSAAAHTAGGATNASTSGNRKTSADILAKYRDTSEIFVEDITLDFFYKPHTLTLLFASMVAIVYIAFASGPDKPTAENVKIGVWACVFILLVVSLVAFPNGPFTRPHPAVWRLVMGISVAYLLFLVFLLLQSRTDAEAILTGLIGEKLGTSHNFSAESYADNCELTWSNINTKLDRFVLAHSLGWVIKTLMVRNAVLCWLMSILWEVTEVMFMQMLPNFAECWWDALVLDVLLCNGVGIFIGLRLCKYLEMRQYNWESITTIPTISGKIRRAVLQFTPGSWTHVRWELGTAKRMFALTILVLIFTIIELNSFFLKHIFFVRTSHPINPYRMLLWCLMGAPALRQLYVYITDVNCKRLGTHCWICGAIMFIELFICIKFGRGFFPESSAIRTMFWWFVMLVVCSLIALYMFAKHETIVEGPALKAKISTAVFANKEGVVSSSPSDKTPALAPDAPKANSKYSTGVLHTPVPRRRVKSTSED